MTRWLEFALCKTLLVYPWLGSSARGRSSLDDEPEIDIAMDSYDDAVDRTGHTHGQRLQKGLTMAEYHSSTSYPAVWEG